ncbi:MAG: glycoside hydrolase family 3 N-terminal domain-containing protein [Nannocystaceae bacterium]
MTAAHAGDLSTGAAARLDRAARRWLPRLAGAGRVLAPLAVLVVALIYRTPLVASLRGLLLGALALTIPLALALEVRALRRRPGRARRLLVVAWALLLALFVGIEGRFRVAKARVLAAAPAELQAIGEHIVVGFRNLDELRELARRGGVAGIYVSRRNLESIDPAEIVATLAELQAARRDRGQPPLLVAADQEGGVVSHMSPPLTRLPPLSSLVDPRTGRAERAALLDYADTHARELRSLGVNVNFAPVVDLRVAVDRAFDRFTKIEARAISDDPEVVAAVAAPYCEGLRGRRVACTLKHFPGIGRVREDTHYFAGHLESPRGALEGAEWRPFRALTAGSPPSTLVMLSHTIVDALDRDLPASMSTPVVDGLLRREWGYDGVLVTDDLSMFPISLGPGVGEASVRGLAAGVDLLLISYDPDLYYEAVDELLDRWEELPAEPLARSRRRVDALRGWLAAGS